VAYLKQSFNEVVSMLNKMQGDNNNSNFVQVSVCVCVEPKRQRTAHHNARFNGMCVRTTGKAHTIAEEKGKAHDR